MTKQTNTLPCMWRTSEKVRNGKGKKHICRWFHTAVLLRWVRSYILFDVRHIVGSTANRLNSPSLWLHTSHVEKTHTHTYIALGKISVHLRYRILSRRMRKFMAQLRTWQSAYLDLLVWIYYFKPHNMYIPDAPVSLPANLLMYPDI